MFRECIERIIWKCDGAIAGVVMGFDGIAVEATARDQQMDVQTIGMEFSFVLGQVRKTAEILDVGGLEEVTVRSKNMTFIIRVLNEDYFLGIALTPEGNFGKGRFLMRMAAPELLAQFYG